MLGVGADDAPRPAAPRPPSGPGSPRRTSRPAAPRPTSRGSRAHRRGRARAGPAGPARRPRARPARRPTAAGRPRGCGAVGSVSPGRVTRPSSKIARSRLPRLRLRRSTGSRVASSEVRSSGCSSDSGLASRSARRRGSSAGSRKASWTSGADERVAQHLDAAAVGQRPGHRAPPALGRGQPPTGRRHRQHGRDPVVALEPGDLLDQVDSQPQVRPPARRRRRSGRDAAARALGCTWAPTAASTRSTVAWS